MPTLRFATSVPYVRLAFVEEAAATDADQPLEGVHALALGDEVDDTGTRHRLVVIQDQDPRLGERAQLNRLMTALRRSGAAGVAVALPPGALPPPSVRAAARQHGVPLLSISDDPAHWLTLHNTLTAQNHDRAMRTAELHQRLLEQAHHLGRPDGTQRMVAWLASFTDAYVAVLGAAGPATACGPAPAPDVLAPARETIEDLARTGRGAAAVDADGLQIRLFAIGPRTAGDPGPSHVLAVAAPAHAFTPETNTATARILDLLALQASIEAAAIERRRLRRGEAGVRQAVLQLLMTGHVTDAQRTVEGLSPGVLDTDECRVFILRTRHADRTAVIQDCQDAVAGSALVSACPAFPDQVIVVVPHGGTEQQVVDGLTAVTRKAPNRYLGGSATRQLAETDEAYIDASRALIVAERVAERVHLYAAEVQLSHILDARADAWARAYLAPLLNLPGKRREPLLATLPVGLHFTPAAAARILGSTHRNTVARRLKEAGEVLGIDLQDIRQRSALALALELRTRAERLPEEPAEPAALEEILRADEVRRWADRFLQPLRTDRRPLTTTLKAWVRANSAIEATAEALGVNPATVRSHLRAAERLLQRRLVTGTSLDLDAVPDTDAEAVSGVVGAHDVVLALSIPSGADGRI
ncbi:helix-turn-helix domain-containing protein (plasmid) [Streptomyces viridifaciens]|nr:helix-turn-helix domain-containing protein [Streptomyces viridifaciens]